MRYISLFARAALLAVILVAAPHISDAAPSADDVLAKAVSEKLMQGKNNFDATDIIVTSEDGVVNLRGEVHKAKEVGRMIDTAMDVPGVRRVETQIDIRDWQSR